MARTQTPDTAAVLVAGGSGTRFGGPTRKQYLQLEKKPIVWWSLNAFEKAPSIGEIILVVPQDDVATLQSLARQWKFSKLLSIVAGGPERFASVANGLRVVPPHFSYVAVHDAVRPLVTSDLIERIVAAARKRGAAIAALPCRDTVKGSANGQTIQKTLDRNKLWMAQTPQIFEKLLLDRAHRIKNKTGITDDAQLVERLGKPVQLVASTPSNIKVTVPDDLVLAKLFLQNRRKKDS